MPGKVQFAVSGASLIFQKRIPDAVQNQNSLLVSGDNCSPGAVTGGKLVPSSHKRCNHPVPAPIA